MYCKNCGKLLNDKAIICTSCNTKVGDGNQYCAECGEEVKNKDLPYCLNCGCPLNLSLNSKSVKDCSTKELKDESKKIISNPAVHAKSVFVVAFAIPFGIFYLIYKYLLYEQIMVKPVTGFILGVIFAIPFSYICYNLICRTKDGFDNKKVDIKFEFNAKQWLPIFIVMALQYGILGVTQALNFTIKVDSLLGISTPLMVIVPLVELAVLLLLIPLDIVYYVSVNRNKGAIGTIIYSYKIGFRYYWQILKLELSFIPLMLLIGITFGILLIWKGYYLYLTNYNLAHKLVEEYEAKEKIVQ